MDKTISDILKEYLNKEIPEEDFVFRRVPLSLFLQGRPNHTLDIVPQIFRNERGDGMSVDWERICHDPQTTQIRDGRDPNTNGVIGLSVLEIKKFPECELRVINDQVIYSCHCLLKGIPMSLKQLKKLKREIFDKLSSEEKTEIQSSLIAIREHLCEHAFWIIPLIGPKLKSLKPGFNYSDHLTEVVRDFFQSRNHKIPS